jgi:hypothetical protein
MLKHLKWLEPLKKKAVKQQGHRTIKLPIILCSECGIYTEDGEDCDSRPTLKGHPSVSPRTELVFN